MSPSAVGREPNEKERRDGYLTSPLNRKRFAMSQVSESLLDKALGVSAMVCDHRGREEIHVLATAPCLPRRRWNA
jgi:hypothetical protein